MTSEVALVSTIHFKVLSNPVVAASIVLSMRCSHTNVKNLPTGQEHDRGTYNHHTLSIAIDAP